MADLPVTGQRANLIVLDSMQHIDPVRSTRLQYTDADLQFRRKIDEQAAAILAKDPRAIIDDVEFGTD